MLPCRGPSAMIRLPTAVAIFSLPRRVPPSTACLDRPGRRRLHTRILTFLMGERSAKMQNLSTDGASASLRSVRIAGPCVIDDERCFVNGAGQLS